MSQREILEKLESQNLAPYALRSSASKGRRYQESPHPVRTDFQRDRDRVIYCNAFRRLEYKTQVFPNHEGDHYRTRLTHTIEVANLTRTMARCLKLNEDFSECLALVHDIGHPPFGHIGEEVLAELMQDFGGFEHNEQTHRIVTKLENSYTDYPGLNLTDEVLEAILQHTKLYRQRYPDAKEAYLETQLVSLTDEMAYNAHDMEDGLSSGILIEDEVMELAIMNDISHQEGFPSRQQARLRRRYLVRQVLNTMVLDFMSDTQKNLEQHKPANPENARELDPSPLQFSQNMYTKKAELEQFLHEKMYRHPKVARMMNKSRYFLERMFKHFQSFPEELPQEYQSRFDEEGKERSIADYLSGMTDRYLQELYIRLFTPFQKSL
jgi:dGTPase